MPELLTRFHQVGAAAGLFERAYQLQLWSMGPDGSQPSIVQHVGEVLLDTGMDQGDVELALSVASVRMLLRQGNEGEQG